MIFQTFKNISHKNREEKSNIILGFFLSFVAGAMNAGGFLALSFYTSHVTGLLSSIPDQFILNNMDMVKNGIYGLICFFCGAVFSTILVNYGKVKNLHSEYAIPLVFESFLILWFGFSGAFLNEHDTFIPVTVMLLCFIMGLQNALISKISNSIIRTTHMTGIVTDLGIEIGKWLHSISFKEHHVKMDKKKMLILLGLILFFSLGGFTGVYGFKFFSYSFVIPLALILMLFSVIPIYLDIKDFIFKINKN